MIFVIIIVFIILDLSVITPLPGTGDSKVNMSESCMYVCGRLINILM